MLGIFSKTYMIASRMDAFEHKSEPFRPVRAVRRRLRESREAAALRRLTDRQLRDAGLTRQDVERAAPRSFWNWRG